jgi:hypothetical protein
VGSPQFHQGGPIQANGSCGMILSDREIQAALVREAVVITPTPTAEAWSSTAVDLTHGTPDKGYQGIFTHQGPQSS